MSGSAQLGRQQFKVTDSRHYGQPDQSLLPHATEAPPPGPAAFDYYTAQSDYLQEVMRSQPRAPQLTPHIVIKGQSQPMQTMQPTHAHSSYASGLADSSSASAHGHRHADPQQQFESALEHDDDFLNSFHLPPLKTSGGEDAASRLQHLGEHSGGLGFANMPLHMVDRDFESLPAELPSHVMERLLLANEASAAAASPRSSSQLHHHHAGPSSSFAPAPSPSPGAAMQTERAPLVRTFSAPSGADLEWVLPGSARSEMAASQQQQQQQQTQQQQQQQHQQQHQHQDQHQQQHQLQQGPDARGPAGHLATAGLPQGLHMDVHPLRDTMGVSRRRAEPSREPQQLLMGCSAELREFAAHADIEQLHKVYLTPASKRKGKGGRQPATDPRLDPSVDPKKARRILANRLSAARSKLKQRSQVDDLQRQIEGLARRKESMQDDITSLQASCNEQVQTNSQLSQRLQVLQQHHEVQSREHAKLVDAHAQLRLQVPSPANNNAAGGGLAVDPIPSNPLLSPPAGPLPAQAAPASQATEAAPSSSAPEQPGVVHDNSEASLRARNRLVQELQRFDLPQELRQVLMNISAAPSSAGSSVSAPPGTL